LEKRSELLQPRGEIFISVEYERTEGWVDRRMLKESPIVLCKTYIK
jgi:hypothetical protein